MRWDMTENIVGVAVEKRWAKVLGKDIRQVDRCVNTFQDQEVTFDPFAEGVVFDVHMACACSWLLRHCHSRACIVVFIENRGSILWDAEVP